MWTAAFVVAAIVAFWDQIRVRKRDRRAAALKEDEDRDLPPSLRGHRAAEVAFARHWRGQAEGSTDELMAALEENAILSKQIVAQGAEIKQLKEAVHWKADDRASKLIVHSAYYGTKSINYVAVSEDTLRQNDGGAIAVFVSNNLVPRDPVPGVVKHLTVEYSYGDHQVRNFITRAENQLLILPEDLMYRSAAQRDLTESAARIKRLESELVEFRNAAQASSHEDALLAQAPKPLITHSVGDHEGRPMEVLEFFNDGPTTMKSISVDGVSWKEHRHFTSIMENPFIPSRHREAIRLLFNDGDHFARLESVLRKPEMAQASVPTVTVTFQDSNGNTFARDYELKTKPYGGINWNPGDVRLLTLAGNLP